MSITKKNIFNGQADMVAFARGEITQNGLAEKWGISTGAMSGRIRKDLITGLESVSKKTEHWFKVADKWKTTAEQWREQNNQLKSKIEHWRDRTQHWLTAEEQATKINEQLTAANEQLVKDNEQAWKKVEQLTAANEQLVKDNEQATKINEQLTAANEQLVKDNEQAWKKVEQLTAANEQLTADAEQAKGKDKFINFVGSFTAENILLFLLASFGVVASFDHLQGYSPILALASCMPLGFMLLHFTAKGETPGKIFSMLFELAVIGIYFDVLPGWLAKYVFWLAPVCVVGLIAFGKRLGNIEK